MLRLDKIGKSLHRLQPKKLADAGFLERTHVQQMIRQNAGDFFAELGETLLLIGEEIEPTDFLLQSKEQFQKLPGAIESLQNTTFVQSGSSTESEETDTEAKE
jgi:hypothetical protein